MPSPGRRRLVLLVVAAIAAWRPAAQAQTPAGAEPVVTSDLLRLRSIGSIDVSRDGAAAVVAVQSVGSVGGLDTPVANERRHANQSHLYLLELHDPGSSPRQLTFGDRRDVEPRLSPDGRFIAFVRGGVNTDATDPEARARAQIWMISTEGGEARQVTDLPFGAASPRWSPDGDLLVVSARIPMSELPGAPSWSQERPGRDWHDAGGVEPRPDGTRAEIRAWLHRNASRLDPTVITRLDFQEERGLRGVLDFAHLLVVDPHDPEVPPRRITEGFVDHTEAVFLPDGAVVCVSTRTERGHLDRAREGGLWRIDLADGAERELVAAEGWTLRSPQPSHDGTVLAFLGARTDEPAHRPLQLGLASIGDATVEPEAWLTGPTSFDASVITARWMPARTSLLFNAPVRGGFPLMEMSPGLLEPAALVDELDGARAGVSAFGVGGGTIIYGVATPRNPCTLRMLDARGDREIWDLNAWVASKRLSTPRGGTVSRPDGLQVEYWVMEPTDRRPGMRYPLVLAMHGGPAGMWGPGESTMWHELQLLCSWGYGVVYANPRGSGGYGYEFKRANFQDWGTGPAGDVLGVVDEVARLHDWIDTDRLVITGGSYAGYLTAWIVGHDHRFKAAVAQRGVYHLPTFFGEGNAWRLVESSMGGFAWEARIGPILERESPFTYVDRIKTPLLILHGSDDLRTGVSQSEMMYRALKQLDRDVEYVRYPDAGHDLSRTGGPLQRMDRLDRIIEFFERFVENPREAPVLDRDR